MNPTLFTLSLGDKEEFLSMPYPVPWQKRKQKKPFRQLEIKATKNPFPSGYCEGRISLPVDFCKAQAATHNTGAQTTPCNLQMWYNPPPRGCRTRNAQNAIRRYTAFITENAATATRVGCANEPSSGQIYQKM